MWDPEKYLDFADARGRPFHDLVARIGARTPRRVVDLGCGPGNLTTTLASRWPDAAVDAIDGSPEMVAAANVAGVRATVGDVVSWRPAPDTDVLVSNAVLQWVSGHDALLRRWATELPDGAWIAMQMPGNFDGASHALVRELAAAPRWRAGLAGVLRPADVVADPVHYADLFADAGCAVDAWETTYAQRLNGPDPVLEWITGTALRPVRNVLSDQEWGEFRAELAPKLRVAYPARPDGTTWFPFRRVFVVARVGAGD